MKNTVGFIGVVLLTCLISIAPLPAANEGDNGAGQAPVAKPERGVRDYDGELVLFPDDVAAGVEETPANAYYTDKMFQAEHARRSAEFLLRLEEAHHRLYEAFVHRSNLRVFDEVSHNPYTFVGDHAEHLPEDAIIEWKLTKPEFVSLGLADWESLVLGGANHGRYLQAWIDYEEYTVARLQLELMNARGVQDAELQKQLEETMRRCKAAVAEFLRTPPAD